MLIFIAFCIITFIQLFYFLFLFSRFSFSNKKFSPKTSYPISVIICAKNESNNLKKYLPSIAAQNYPNFEIILVDDGSDDDSLITMNDFKENFGTKEKNISVISIPKENASGKKSALTLGIQNTSFNHLLLTDADCKPATPNWITLMSSSFVVSKSIVLGYGAYEKVGNSFLNKLIRFETLLTALQYFSYSMAGLTYMGVGRNLAYLKTEFRKIDGFNLHKNIASGDDDLFINTLANTNNTSVCFDPESFTISKPKLTFRAWIQQKRRHLTTAYSYKKLHQFLLGLFYLTQLLFWILPIVLILLKFNLWMIGSVMVLRFIIWYLIIAKAAKKLNEKDLVTFAPIFEISIIFIQLYIYLRNKIATPNQW